MLPRLRRIRIVFSFLSTSLALGCSLLARTPTAPSADGILPGQSRALPHEALALPGSRVPSALSVLYPPPPPRPEQPSEVKPDGKDVVWVPGYWIWDTSRDDWQWLSGVWLHAPPGRQWTPGYWSVAADGWRWLPGCWTIVVPPPFSLPPPDSVFAPDDDCLDDPGFDLFAGCGIGGLWFTGRSFNNQRGGESPPAAPVGHVVRHTVPASPAHLDMAAILASMPKALESSLEPSSPFTNHAALNGHGAFGAAELRHDFTGRMTALFLNPHLETALHDRNARGDCSSRDLAVERNAERGRESGSREGGGHGGGRGR